MKKTSQYLAALFTALSVGLIGCQKGEHDHDHDDHDHDHAHHDDHDHDHDHADGDHHHEKNVAGPNGGRVIMSVEPHVEFFVTEDRKVRLTVLDEGLKPVAVSGQSATVIAGDRSAPTKLNFAPDGTTLLSDGVLPEGNDFPTVVQLKMALDAEPVIEKFNLNLAECPTCEYREYACTCEH